MSGQLGEAYGERGAPNASTTDYNYTYSTPPKQLTYPPPITMSAPNAGRQSPEPERQSGAQSGQTSDNVNQQGAGPKEGAEKASDNTKDSLSSNPQHTLEKHAEETTSKKV
ncbi:hypothetical protein AA0118_g901 [Alternaria tenuissima]|nr:hypothetical protein AA0118_g901 [Alternaria tenuissima]